MLSSSNAYILQRKYKLYVKGTIAVANTAAAV